MLNPDQQRHDGEPFSGINLPVHLRVPEGNIQRVTCENGLSVFLIPMRNTQDLSVSAVIKVGLPQEGPLAGITHFTEHLMGAGGRKYASVEALDDALSELGGGLGLTTYPDRLMITLEGLAMKPETFLEVLKDVWAYPAFTASDVHREREVIDREIRQRASGLTDAASQILLSLCFPESDFSKPIPGTRRSIQSITESHLREYHRTHMGPQNTYVVFSGAIPVGFEKQIQEKLGSIVFPQGAVTTAPPVVRPSRSVVYTDVGPRDTTFITLCVPGFPAGAPEAPAVEVLNVALCGRMNSRLMRALRGTNGKTYGVSGAHDDVWTAGIERFSFFTNPGDEVKLLALFKQEIDDVAKNGLSSLEFENALGFARAYCIRNMERPSLIAKALALDAASRGGTGEPLGLHGKLGRFLGMTNDEVTDAAQKLFLDATWQLVLLGENAPLCHDDVAALFS